MSRLVLIALGSSNCRPKEIVMALKSYLETAYGLTRNPFPGNATYGEDSQLVYVPEMFGDQRNEFLRKFVVAPLQNGQPLLGAVWSVVPGDPAARGFGKSTLMGEEAKRINSDHGLSTLMSLGVSEIEARENPILAGYVSFNTKAQGGISSIDAAAFNLVRFILRNASSEAAPSTHQRLQQMAAARLVKQGRAIPGHEAEAIVQAVKDRFRSFAVSVDIRNLLDQYLNYLASPDTDALNKFLFNSVGTWHHDRNGLKYLQILVVFGELAGIQHFTFFVDQVEDFTSIADVKKIHKNVKIIRDALLETEPFSSLASFIFQLHPAAQQRLRDAWRHEDLRSLDIEDPLNEPVIVVLEGLDKFPEARLLAERCLNSPQMIASNRKSGIMPFTEAALHRIWEATRPRPRYFLRALHQVLQLASDKKRDVIDETFVTPLLPSLTSFATESDSSDDALDERLA
jgi:hypothetical protein